MSAGGGCEAAVTARTRYGWDMLRECGELLYGRRFLLKLKGAVHKSYIRPAILHGREIWHPKEREMEILRTTNRSMVTAMREVQHKDIKYLQI